MNRQVKYSKCTGFGCDKKTLCNRYTEVVGTLPVFNPPSNVDNCMFYLPLNKQA